MATTEKRKRMEKKTTTTPIMAMKCLTITMTAPRPVDQRLESP